MPFKSENQRRWMHANHPAMAEKWEAETPTGKRLPRKLTAKRSGKRKTRRSRNEE